MQQLSYATIAGLVQAAEKAGVPLSHLVLADQAQQLERTPQSLWEQMDQSLAVMEESAQMGMRPDIRSTSGLTGGDAARMQAYAKGGSPLAGGPFARAVARALAVSEYNAAMGRIVAAPTAGSCGILPAAVLTMLQDRGASREACIYSLFTAAAVGMVIAQNACIAGAQGGCQAECGSAAAMAAGAVAQMLGGSPEAAFHAAAIAIKNQLGLVCDPVAGLVEIPCIKRNAGGVAIALSASDMALAGVESRIPFDDVVEAMNRVGKALPAALRETAGGGLATTKAGLAMKEKVYGET